MITAQEAYNEMINLLNCCAWYDKEVHLQARKSENIITKYLVQCLQEEQKKEGIEKDGEH